ncbi:MAG TPA: hypothetical protein VKE24_09515 [Candidatus Acidoferrales bacterium]|nr:hypothetical protein [Candidatus Acidoferrales bacterium]
MSRHPYLRAYLAGIALPTMFLLVGITAFCIARFVYHLLIPLERFIVFPMAVVPNLWGAWNMLYVWLRARRRVPLGLFGAALPFLLAPLGFLLGRALGLEFPPPKIIVFFPIALIVYYLAWKHLVGFFNELLGIAG